jgi:hypothetical protein
MYVSISTMNSVTLHYYNASDRTVLFFFKTKPCDFQMCSMSAENHIDRETLRNLRREKNAALMIRPPPV